VPSTLPPVTTSTDTVYMSAGWLRTNLKITDRQLTMAMARKRVRVINNVSLYPMYAVSDVKKYIREYGAGRRTEDAPAPAAPARKRRATPK
jgi:hypothetical protein